MRRFPLLLTALLTMIVLAVSASSAAAQSAYTLKVDGVAIKDVPPNSAHTYQFCWGTDCKPAVSFSAPAAPGPTAKPAIPTGFTVTAGDSQAVLDWNDSPAAEQVDRYQVYRNDVLVSDGPTASNFTATGLSNGTTYNYRVSAHNSLGYGDWTAAISVTPKAPPPPPPPPGTRTGLTFTRVNQGSFGTGFDLSAMRSEVMVTQGTFRTDIIDQSRAANPNVKILVYQNITRAKADSTTTLLNIAQLQAGGWDSGRIDADPAGGDSHIAGVGDPVAYANKACDEWKTKAANLAAAGHRVDGVFLDDDNSYIDSGGQSQATFNPWVETVNQVFSACLKNATSPGAPAGGFIGMPNFASPGEHNLLAGQAGWIERNMKYFPYAYTEFTAWWPGGAAQGQNFVNETFRMMGTVSAAGTVWVAGDDVPLTEAKHTFSLGMCMVQAGVNCSKGTGVGSTDTWYPVYDRAKTYGAPTGPAVQTSAGVWERPFGTKKVTVNLNTRVATIP